MKNMTWILMALMMTVFGITAQEKNRSDLSMAQCMMIRGVEKGNLGLQCDAMYRMIQLKSFYPEVETRDMEKVLEKMLSGNTHELVRVYAELTLCYLNDAELRSMVPAGNDELPTDFYQKLQNTLYRKTWLVAARN